MKLKIYLRGLGIGIIVTALIMGISLGGKEEMTDEEVEVIWIDFDYEIETTDGIGDRVQHSDL